MHRLGQSPDRIAGSLRLPKGEVDLLVKVHRIVMRPYEDVRLAPSAGEASGKILNMPRKRSIRKCRLRMDHDDEEPMIINNNRPRTLPA